jgi:hypothetical protein
MEAVTEAIRELLERAREPWMRAILEDLVNIVVRPVNMEVKQ